jgi:dihydroorotate dehydrogenase
VDYYAMVRPILFRMGEPEIAHDKTLAALTRLARRRRLLSTLRKHFGPESPRDVFGVRFPNVVGLAAGIDKDGKVIPAWPALGFGFIEIGTVTWHPQPGNPPPRLFRLPASEAIINRMGFNNEGANALAERLRALGPQCVPLGISIGMSKITPIEDAIPDYCSSVRALTAYADYFAVNVSSPNTPGLRNLQDQPVLDELLGELRQETDRPLLVKIAPDLTEDAIGAVLEVCEKHSIDGLIATNTTVSRDGIAAADARIAQESGGLSGRPLTARALDVVAFASKHTDGKLPIIGVGGICTVDDALRMLDAGACLIQLCTGFVYRGPNLVRQINRRVRGH